MDRNIYRQQVEKLYYAQAKELEWLNRKLTRRDWLAYLTCALWAILTLKFFNATSILYWGLVVVGYIVGFFAFGRSSRSVFKLTLFITAFFTLVVYLVNSKFWFFNVLSILLLIIGVLVSIIAMAWIQGQMVDAKYIKHHPLQPIEQIDHWDELQEAMSRSVPFVLYLRTFFTEAPRGEWIDPITEGSPPMLKEVQVNLSVQAQIQSALGVSFPIYCLRDPTHLLRQSAFKTVLVDPQNWLEEVLKYATHAQLIILHYTHASRGVFEECRLLSQREDLTDKCWLIWEQAKMDTQQDIRDLTNKARWVSLKKPWEELAIPDDLQKLLKK